MLVRVKYSGVGGGGGSVRGGRVLNVLDFTAIIYQLSDCTPGLLQVLSASSSLPRVSVFLITTITCFLFTLGQETRFHAYRRAYLSGAGFPSLQAIDFCVPL